VEEHSASFHEDEKQKTEKETRERLLNELAGKATHAEVVKVDDQKEERKNSFIAACICLVLVLRASIIAGILVPRQTSDEGLVPPSVLFVT
jgi:hypothetical protein